MTQDLHKKSLEALHQNLVIIPSPISSPEDIFAEKALAVNETLPLLLFTKEESLKSMGGWEAIKLARLSFTDEKILAAHYKNFFEQKATQKDNVANVLTFLRELDHLKDKPVLFEEFLISNGEPFRNRFDDRSMVLSDPEEISEALINVAFHKITTQNMAKLHVQYASANRLYMWTESKSLPTYINPRVNISDSKIFTIDIHQYEHNSGQDSQAHYSFHNIQGNDLYVKGSIGTLTLEDMFVPEIDLVNTNIGKLRFLGGVDNAKIDLKHATIHELELYKGMDLEQFEFSSKTNIGTITGDSKLASFVKAATAKK